MNIFVTGATGYIGGVVAEKLQEAGHQVTGLARSDASAEVLQARGIEVVRGGLSDTQVLAEAAHAADGIIHTAFSFEGGDFYAGVAAEETAVRAFMAGVEGTDKPLIVTSGTGILGDTGERVFDEDTPIALPTEQAATENPGMKAVRGRLQTEAVVLGAAGVHGIVIRPPSVYGRSDGGSLLSWLKAAAPPLGAVPYAAGTADHLWSFVHIDDLADLYVLALEANRGELFHAGAESGVRTKALAEAMSIALGLGGKTVELDMPELGEALEAPPRAGYWAMNSQSSGEKARRLLGWNPQHVDLLTELMQRPR